MRSLVNQKIWSHLSIAAGQTHTNREIRISKSLPVATFRELVPVVARIANHNPDYTLFFRGQNKDFTLRSGASSFYPTIFRSPGRRLMTQELQERLRILDQSSKLLVSALEENKTDGITKLKKFPELQWSILQHYGVCLTPLIDLTHSLRVAASFALQDGSESGHVFAFALPHPQGTITYSSEDELLNIRLLSASPFSALRPHFQEGYVVGNFPSRPERKHWSLDLGVRLVAKLAVIASGFWSDSFPEIPKDALYPENDEIEGICTSITNQVARV